MTEQHSSQRGRRKPARKYPNVQRKQPPSESSDFFALSEQYPDERSAERYFTDKRWPQGPRCTSCDSDDVYDGKSARKHTQWKCRKCHKQFTVMSGTVMESTKIPLRKWLFAFHLLGGAKKGLSSRYLARQLGITLKSAWHLSHRIRATMTNNGQKFSGTVETDETYIGGKRKHVGHGYRKNKIAVQTIVQRPKKRRYGASRRGAFSSEELGQAQTIALDPYAGRVDGRTVGAKLRTHTDPSKTVLMTDESPIYAKVGESFKEHHTVNHRSEDYAHVADDGHHVHTNTAEGLFANLKRQIHGTHHSTSKKHLPRYLEEFDHKYNNRDKTDKGITEAAIGNMTGKRVTLFKSKSGEGESLIDTKQGEKRPHSTKRGSSTHERTGKKASSVPAVESPSEIARVKGARGGK